MTKPSDTTLSAQSTLRDVLAAFPGAPRALFRGFHIGGCSSCAFQLDETLAQLCQRHGGLEPQTVLAHLRRSHEEDARLWLAPHDLARECGSGAAPKLVDVRSREEFEAVHIAGSVLLSQPVMQEILGRWPRGERFVVVDHRGQQALDAAAFFAGHGFEHVRCLRGGVDAWALEVDPSLRRYRLD
jgi:rhodanese-related sulfurtransferase